MKKSDWVVGVLIAVGLMFSTGKLDLSKLRGVIDDVKPTPKPVVVDGSIQACDKVYHALQEDNYNTMADKLRAGDYPNDTALKDDMEKRKDAAFKSAHTPYRERLQKDMGDLKTPDSVASAESFLRQVAKEHGSLK